MLEPRRLAARSAAERLAANLGERLGDRVGYSVRLESRTSAATRLEVVTAGLFLRRLQADPALEGVACVIFDEFHERQAEADLALALVRQARSLLRTELRLLVMSATLDLEPLAAELDGASVISCEGRSHPVTVAYQPPRQEERLERQVLRALEGHWLDQPQPRGTVLVFLPGLGELEAARRAIEATPWGAEVDCVVLHGQLPLAAQGRAIAATRQAAGKVVLATSVAESSLTIAGVTLVIDSGLSRLSRFDPTTGMDGLVTQPASQASAEQRRGRAGRLGPGHCLRLWSRRNNSGDRLSIPRNCLRSIPCRSPCNWRNGAARRTTRCPGSRRPLAVPWRRPAACCGSWGASMAAGASPAMDGPWPAWGSIPGWPTCCCWPGSGAGSPSPVPWPCC